MPPKQKKDKKPPRGGIGGGPGSGLGGINQPVADPTAGFVYSSGPIDWRDITGNPGGVKGQGPGVGGQPGTGPGTQPGEPGGGGLFNQGAFDAMYALLNEFGLSSLGDFLRDLILDGTTDSASLMLALQQTNEWKTRFAGNEMLRQSGLGVLSPAEYLAVERSYAQVMRNYGLPSGFYDDPSDFAQWIGRSVSAAELQQRVSAYADIAKREDPAIRQQLQSMGLTQGDFLAYVMDPNRAAPLIMRQYQTALLGGAARRAGVSDLNNDYLGHLSDIGISEQQAAQGYGAIGASQDEARTLSKVYGIEYGLRDMEAEVFENSAGASTKRRRLASQERASFSGSSGVGALSGDSAGSY